jgi:hypothetical protein
VVYLEKYIRLLLFFFRSFLHFTDSNKLHPHQIRGHRHGPATMADGADPKASLKMPAANTTTNTTGQAKTKTKYKRPLIRIPKDVSILNLYFTRRRCGYPGVVC